MQCKFFTHFLFKRYNFSRIDNDNPAANQKLLLGQWGQLGMVADLFKVQTITIQIYKNNLTSGKEGWLFYGMRSPWRRAPQQQLAIWDSVWMVGLLYQLQELFMLWWPLLVFYKYIFWFTGKASSLKLSRKPMKISRISIEGKSITTSTHIVS